MEKILLEPGNYYHIYNRGNNGQDIFFENKNYLFFLKRYHQYISPVCDTIAWVLLRNHFHFLIYVKPIDQIEIEKLEYTTVEKPRKIDASLQFGHLFNSYSKAINKMYHRTGSLFEKNFERKVVDNPIYFKSLIHYIHNNPVKHGFCEFLWDYPWSSYDSVISHRPTHLNREFVLSLFENSDSFKLFHKEILDYQTISDLILE